MNKITSINDRDYTDWIIDLKERYRQSQIKAAINVNSELIKFNWLLGKDIVDMKADSKWGDSFYDTLSNDIKKFFPKATGFSSRNLLYMKQFYTLFPADEITPQLDAQIMPQVGAQIYLIPWNHIKLIIDKCGKIKILIHVLNKLVKSSINEPN